MLTLQRRKYIDTVSLVTAETSVDDLLEKEWLLTNERGSYASSTVVGCNTRSYHGLLTGSLNPPANRVLALANCMEMVIAGRQVFNLSTFEFEGKFAPSGFGHIRCFSRDTGAHFEYSLPHVGLTKSVYLARDSDTVLVVYSFTDVSRPVDLTVRPFVALRDFHMLQRSYARLCAVTAGEGLSVRHDAPSSCELLLSCPGVAFERDPQWWFNFVYRVNRQRGQEYMEDLWTPGFVKVRIEQPREIAFWASLNSRWKLNDLPTLDADGLRQDLDRHRSNIVNGCKDSGAAVLCVAADQFIARRKADTGERATILAGYPWFADWGRDAFIALPGLLLTTGRFDDARSVLTTFAAAVDEGMIPNRFDDRGETAYFNSVDASLWFVNAAFQYLAATKDARTFSQDLLPVIKWIVDAYQKGTRFGIRADSDGLVLAGNDQTQLTWMDAKYDGVAFTPRWGKTVEVNALWYNALASLAQYYQDRNAQNAAMYSAMADRVGQSFCEVFWNDDRGYLNDTVLPDGTVDASLRPNQILSVSLAHTPPLSVDRQRAIVEVVEKRLLTPHGLRTLDPDNSAYCGKYEGSPRARDAAYHQGTVWAYLIGPFVEAYLKVNRFSRQSRSKAAELIEPLMRHLTEQACLGSVSEIFDGDPPHAPRGCIAQAWSVAELIRANHLIKSR